MRAICAAGFLAATATVSMLIVGCAAPGPPVTREPRVPRAISDLSAKQSGDSIYLSFTFPIETAQGRKLAKTPAIEIYRTFATAQADSGEAAQPQLALTIPSHMTGKYLVDGEIHFSDALAPAELAAHAGGEAVYSVRTRLGRHESADSNVVRVKIFPAPSAIEDLRAHITQDAVELLWTAATIAGEGSGAATEIRYRVYRAEVERGDLPANAAHGGTTNETKSTTRNEKGQPVLLGETSAPAYGDTKFEFGRTYAYSVRSVAVYKGGSVESGESNVLIVTPRDTFAPAAPAGLVAMATAASGATAVHVDLSWAINSESDLQGYNVYRSESENDTGTKLNVTPLLTPVFRDDSVEAGKKYFYHVTAIDRAGNESVGSAVVSVGVPASGEKNP